MKERILASLKGIASGDAIGKQTETLSRADVLRWYPEGIRGFEGPPGTVIPRYAGSPRRGAAIRVAASIAGSILGARNPGTVSDQWHAVVEMVNGHGLIPLGEALAGLRR